MRKILFCIFLILLCVYFYTCDINEPVLTVPIEEKTEEKVIRLLDSGNVISILLEDYIIGVVACEMPASFELEALKSQAVASRTYALERMNYNKEYDLENSTNNQCYNSIEQMKTKWGNNYEKYYNKIKEAVSLTSNQYMTYDGEIIKAFYFSSSNGYTENVKSVFGSNLDYLVVVDSKWDKEISSYEKTVTFPKEEFLKLLTLEITDEIKINIDSKTESDRVEYITVNNKTFKGTTFRKLLTLRSTDFDIKEKGENIEITTRGYGHGVGLSQNGANGMAKEGYDYIEILKHYYKDIELINA